MNRRELLRHLGLVAAGVALSGCDTTGNEGGGLEPPPPPPPGTAPALRLDPAVSYQTLLGWQGVAQIGQWRADTTQAFFDSYKVALWDDLVALGLTSLQVGVPVGLENDADYFQMAEDAFLAGDPQADTLWQTFRTGRHHPKPTGRYYWSFVDSALVNCVNPMRARILARGEQPHVMLSVGDQNGNTQPAGTYLAKDNPDRVAAMLVALFRHIEATYGWLPDAIQLINEPDVSVASYSTTQLSEMVRYVGQSLAAAGYQPDLLLPGCARASEVPRYFDAAWNTSVNRSFVKGIAFHTYQNPSPADLIAIKARLATNRLYGLHTEWVKLGASGLHTLVKEYDASGVCRLAAAFPNPSADPDSGDWLNVVNPGGQIVHSRSTKLLRQFTVYIRPGAVRKRVTSDAGAPDATAWQNPNGKWVVVAKTTGTGKFGVVGLPAGTYGVSYGLGHESNPPFGSTNSTTIVSWDQHLPDQALAAGAPLQVDSSGAGYYTIYGK